MCLRIRHSCGDSHWSSPLAYSGTVFSKICGPDLDLDLDAAVDAAADTAEAGFRPGLGWFGSIPPPPEAAARAGGGGNTYPCGREAVMLGSGWVLGGIGRGVPVLSNHLCGCTMMCRRRVRLGYDPLYTLREKEKEHKPVYESMHTFWTIIYLSARLLFMSLCERKERNKASEKGGMTFWNE